jgi:hypothetical protein
VGADIGRAFALTHDMGERRAEAVWDSIALHTIPSIEQHKGADVACGQNGIACDYGLGGHLKTGTTPARVVERLRADLARGRVEATAEPVERIAESVGFGDAENMRRAFIRIYGRPPQSIRRAIRT